MYKRVDDNQKLITEAFRKLGCSVFITSSVGKGFPDLVVGKQGKNYLIEVKDGDKSASRRKLTGCEELFFQTWKGQVRTINSAEEALKFVETINAN